MRRTLFNLQRPESIIFYTIPILLHYRIDLALLMTKLNTLCIQDLPKTGYRPIFIERASIRLSGARINYFLHQPHNVAHTDSTCSPLDETGHIVNTEPPKNSLSAHLFCKGYIRYPGTRINYFLHQLRFVAQSDIARSPNDETGHIVNTGPHKNSL